MDYRREIDGLRAVAVLPVILFHAGFETFSGGFAGVDVFFVISGYLITTILISDISQEEFSILRFYERRARRILPALFTVILICLPFAYLWLLPSQLVDFSQSVVATIFFASNILFWREEGYFAAAAETKPLLHTWSLAVEEQYYLLFPLFLFLTWRLGSKRVFWLIVATAFLSLLLSEIGWRTKPQANFYLAPTRAWELFVGSICAFLLWGRLVQPSNFLSGLGLSLVILSMLIYDSATPFPSMYTLVPVAGTALIILYGYRGTAAARILSLGPLVGIGLISYSAYLWHQPLFAFARVRSLAEPSDIQMLTLGAAALVLAWLSWRFVEEPFRRRPEPLFATRTRLFLASGAGAAVLLAIGAVGILSEGLPNRTLDGISYAEIERKTAVNYGLDRACNGNLNTAPACRTSETPRILLWGDSYAMHLAQGLLAGDEAVAMQQQTRSSCAPIPGLAQVNERLTRNWARGCHAFNADVLDWIRQTPSLEIVILASEFRELLSDPVLTEAGELLQEEQGDRAAEGLVALAEVLRQLGKRVVVVSPTPLNERDTGHCLVRLRFSGGPEDACDYGSQANSPADELLRKVSGSLPVFWLGEAICESGICDTLQDDIFIFRDAGHLSREGSEYLGRRDLWLETMVSLAR